MGDHLCNLKNRTWKQAWNILQSLAASCLPSSCPLKGLFREIQVCHQHGWKLLSVHDFRKAIRKFSSGTPKGSTRHMPIGDCRLAQLGLSLNMTLDFQGFKNQMISKFPIISNDERDEAELIGNLYSPGTSSPHAKTLSQAGNGLLSPPDRLREDDEAGPSRMVWELVAMRSQHVGQNPKMIFLEKRWHKSQTNSHETWISTKKSAALNLRLLGVL